MNGSNRFIISALLSYGLVATAGCGFVLDGGGGGGGASGVDTFVGTWSCEVEEKVTCGDQTETNQQSGTWIVNEGSDTDLFVEGESGCKWGLNVEGDTASPPDGVSCTAETANGNTATLEPTSCELTLTDETTFTEDCTFDATVETDEGTQDCTFEETGTCNEQ